MKLDATVRGALAARAKLQREQLGLAGRTLAERLAVTGVSLSNWEKCLPHTTRHDARWETELEVPLGWLRNEAIETPALPDAATASATFSGTTIGAFIETMCTWCARTTRSDRTTQFDPLSEREQRLATILARRYGIAGEANATLQTIGDMMGLTRERVRQIADKAMMRFEPVPPPAPLVEQFQAAIIEHAPFQLTNPPAAVRDVVGDSQSLEGADRFFREVLGRPLVHTKAYGTHDTMVVAADTASDDLVQLVRQVSVAMIRQAGAAHV
jgi:transcriptional regulator with XRE-family HTH domain